MKIHLVDGTYELFRSHYGAPPRKSPAGQEVGATVGLVRSMFSLVSSPGVTHIACAFDHVIESFRNRLYDGYKTGQGVEPDLIAQFPLAEEAMTALGIVVMAHGRVRGGRRHRDGGASVCRPARRGAGRCLLSRQGPRAGGVGLPHRLLGSAAGHRAGRGGGGRKFGVRPHSIPDWLALVGDAADGYPGIPQWGSKSAAAVLSQFEHLEDIPEDPRKWGIPPARASRLLESLQARREDAELFRVLATLRTDVPLTTSWPISSGRGLRPGCGDFSRRLGDDAFPERVSRWRDR